MILVRKIEIFEFRGIRHLKIDFKKKNFAICGKNGTGKSGIVDALEFGLTGDISRLGGSGTGGISLKEHAPHVDCRHTPAKSKVIVTVFMPSLNKEAIIERVVNDIHNPLIKPASPEILAVINEVAKHSEFTLSRRELIKYVIAAPSDRAKSVQILLRLEKVETLRAVLQRIANADKSAILPLKKQKDDAMQHLLIALGITEPKIDKILLAVNDSRTQLGLTKLTELIETTSFREGLAHQTSTKPINISKIHALAEIENLKALLKSYADLGKSQDLKDIKTSIDVLNADKTSLSDLTREGFLRTALEHIDTDCCPVCDTDMGIDELKTIVEKKLKNFETISAKRLAIEKQLESYCDAIRLLIDEIRRVKEYGPLLKPVIEITAFDNFIIDIQDKLNKIKSFLPVDDLLNSLVHYGEITKDVRQLIESIETAIKAIPAPLHQDAARDYLIIAQEKLEQYRSISTSHKQAVDQGAISLQLSSTYGTVAATTLEELYRDVEVNFTELYRMINEDDESHFTAQLKPSVGKLNFNVDFYGRGYFPPGAYHSEGHQDGMGLCLYLALMKHILGDNFTFAVLDDVLMSVDAGHRREVCKMLKEKFPDTQFILTTHDEVWLKHMKTAGLVEGDKAIEFRKWDVENGPNEWKNTDVWQEIEDYLIKNDVRAAASLLRHYLEYLCKELCHKWRAKVEFRGDGQYVLGDLLSPATSQLQNLYEEAIKAAGKWKQAETEEKLIAQRATMKELISKSQAEQWQTNASIHYNEWADLDKKDFLPVVAAFRSLTEAFSCKGCNTVFYLTYDKNVRDSLRCSCGTVNINLKGK